uniref:Uncharacterized protein n=1 Tax=Opuntia streptacantha TaxID=393608 RepID=A0A7C8YEJ8_OPUST
MRTQIPSLSTAASRTKTMSSLPTPTPPPTPLPSLSPSLPPSPPLPPPALPLPFPIRNDLLPPPRRRSRSMILEGCFSDCGPMRTRSSFYKGFWSTRPPVVRRRRDIILTRRRFMTRSSPSFSWISTRISWSRSFGG